MCTLQNGHRIKVRNVTAERTAHPFHSAALFNERALGVQVVHVLRPVLYRAVAEVCSLLYIQLNAACMEIRNIVFWRRASFDEVQVCALINDDERVLELTGTCCIQSEIRLERNLHLHILGNVDKAAAAPHRSVQRRKLMVSRRNKMHEIFLHHSGIRSGKRALHVSIHDALLAHFVLHIVVDKFAVVLCADPCKRLALSVRNAELFKRVLDVLWNVSPLCGHLGLWLHVRDNLLYVEVLDVRPPVRFVYFVEELERLEAKFLHPRGVVLFLADFIHNGFVEPLPDFVKVLVVLFVAEVVPGAVDVRNLCLCFFRFVYHQSVPSLFALTASMAAFAAAASFSLRSAPFISCGMNWSNPCSLISCTSEPSPVCTMWPFTITCV